MDEKLATHESLKQDIETLTHEQIHQPVLKAGTGNMTKDSVVLLDQIRAVDMQRIIKYLGSLSTSEYAPIAAGIADIFQ